MPFLGEKLRYKRMAIGLSLKEAAKQSGIKRKYVEALEQEDVLSFRDKKTVIDNLEKYAAVLNLNRDEIMEEFEYLWSDSSTAKAYLQKRYSRGGKNLFSGDRKMIAYGAAVLSAALFLSIGGYLVWGSLSEQAEQAGLTPPVEELEEPGPGSPGMEEYLHDEQEPDSEMPLETKETPVQTAQNELDLEPDCESEEPADPAEVEEQDHSEESEKSEPEKKDPDTEFEDIGISVPRTDGNMHLLLTGFYFIASGILLLIGLQVFCPCRDQYMKR